MAATVEMQNTGGSDSNADVVASVEHALADRAGDWRVLIIGSQGNDRWEMKITGPNAFERSYTLEGAAGEHRPESPILDFRRRFRRVKRVRTFISTYSRTSLKTRLEWPTRK